MKKSLLFIALITSFWCNGQEPDKKLVKKVEEWIQAAGNSALAGNADSARLLGEFYATNYALLKPQYLSMKNWLADNQKAIEWYKIGSKTGCSSCGYKAAKMLLDIGIKDERLLNYDTLIFYYKIAADDGNPDALRMLGAVYQIGKKDIPSAIYWFHKAVAAGDANSVDLLAGLELSKEQLYAKGEAASQADNLAEALKWFKLGAEFKDDARAAYNVGIIYSTGLTGPKDAIAAQPWYELAGKLGSADGNFEAAKYYYDKWIASDNSDHFATRARYYWEKAAALGETHAAGWLIRLNREMAEYLAAAQKRRADKAAAKTYSGSQNNNNNNNKSYSSPSSSNSTRTPRRSTCTRCDGKGSIHKTIYGGTRDAQGRTIFGETNTCITCSGKGYSEY